MEAPAHGCEDAANASHRTITFTDGYSVLSAGGFLVGAAGCKGFPSLADPSPTSTSGHRAPADSAAIPIHAFSELDIQAAPLREEDNGTIHRALHRPTKRVVTVKKIPLGIAVAYQREGEFGGPAVTSPWERLSAHRDVKALHESVYGDLCTLHAHYRSPHVVRGFNAFFIDQCLYVVMEWLECGTLLDLPKRLGAVGVLPEPVLAAVGEQVLLGLQEMHHKGLIHRNIRPESVLVHDDGTVKLSNLGSMIDVGTPGGMTVERSGWFGRYMSPERLRGGPHGIASDVWAVGVTLAEYAAGAYPVDFSGCEYDDDKLKRLQQEPLVLHPNLELHYSAEFNAFIMQCMKPDPRDRPAADTLLAHPFLVGSRQRGFNFAQHLRGGAAVPGKGPTSPPTATGPKRHH